MNLACSVCGLEPKVIYRCDRGRCRSLICSNLERDCYHVHFKERHAAAAEEPPVDSDAPVSEDAPVRPEDLGLSQEAPPPGAPREHVDAGLSDG